MKTFTVTKAFKESVTEILMEKKFNAVYPYMNLINREGFEYTEGELNNLVQFLSEFPYANVAEFFASIKENVKELGSEVEESESVSEEN